MIVREEFASRPEREAADWCAIVFDPGASAAELSAFSDWLASDERNEAAFERLAKVYNQVGPEALPKPQNEYVIAAAAFSTFDDFARIAASGESVGRMNRAA